MCGDVWSTGSKIVSGASLVTATLSSILWKCLECTPNSVGKYGKTIVNLCVKLKFARRQNCKYVSAPSGGGHC